MKTLIFVVAYNAEGHIISTLDRIPSDILSEWRYEILVIDDASEDSTSAQVKSYQEEHQNLNLTLITNNENKGYGGNQKLGYQYALTRSFDMVVLLHGDGQYAPEYLSAMIQPIKDQKADVVLGSRMVSKRKALHGGMPFYKWVGNQVLTTLQNMILGTSFSEFHTGYRAFKVSALSAIPFEKNSDYFDFDTEIIIQLLDNGCEFREIEIPTFYGDEISYVNGFKYAWLIIMSTFKSRLVKLGIASDERFNYPRQHD